MLDVIDLKQSLAQKCNLELYINSNTPLFPPRGSLKCV